MDDSRAGRVLAHLHRWLGSATTPVEDRPLLERFVQQRDEDAFAELVSRHGPLVFGLCRRLLGNVHDAEDVFQATFLVLARKAAMIRKPQALSCWLHGVAYRLALRAKAEANKRRLHERQATLICDNTDGDLSWREVRGLLDEELQRLPEKQRLPLVLCYLEGLTQDEASRRLGWPRGTLKRRLETGRERLRIRLTRRGVTLGASLFAAALTESATRGAVPIALRSATVRIAMQFLTKETAALAVTPAVLLAKGVLQTMGTTKLKLGAMVILLFGCVVTAAGLAIPQATPEKQPKNQAESPAPAQPNEEKRVRKNRYGDPLPPGAVARLGTLRLRHPSTATSAAFTRDGKTVIVGDRNGFIVYWDVATGREVRRLQRIPLDIRVLAITHDGKTLACGGWGQANLYLWDIEAGKLISQHELDVLLIRLLRFSPDDKTLIVGDWGKIIRVWDVASSKVTHELKGHTRMLDNFAAFLGEQAGVLSDVAFSPDGKTLASCSEEDPNIRLWDIASGKEKLHFKPHATAVSNLAYSPDGKTIVSCGYDKDDPRFVFSDAKTGKKLREVKDEHWKDDHLNTLQSFQYAPDGKTLFCAEIGGVRVRDAVSGKEIRRLVAPARSMNRLAFSPDGKVLATCGNQHALELWDVAGGKPLHPAPGHRHHITSLVFSADGRQVFSADGYDCPVQVWNARTGERLYELGKYHKPPTSLALSPDGKLLAASCYHVGYEGDAIGLWDPASRKQTLRFIAHKYSPQKSFNGDMPIDWSANGKTLLVSSPIDDTFLLCDAATGKQLQVIRAKQGEFRSSVVLSPDGKIVAAGGYRNGAVRLWSTETGKELRSMVTAPQIPSRTVFTLAFSPDGSLLASDGDWGTIHLWAPATGRLVRQWDTKTERIGGFAFSRDGRTLVSAHDDGSVHLWEPATGKERACLRGHRGGVRAVAISRDGRYIASGSEDTTILVWDAAAGARPDAVLSTEQLRNLWDDLNASDAGRAYRAIWQLAVSPKHALPFLAERLRPVAPMDAAQQKKVNRLLTNLDSERFAIRQQSESELEEMGPMIEPALHKALTSKPSLEVRRRIEKILEKLASEQRRIARALEAIEHMNTPQARRLLESLASGASRAWLSEEGGRSARAGRSSPVQRRSDRIPVRSARKSIPCWRCALASDSPAEQCRPCLRPNANSARWRFCCSVAS